MEQLRQNNFLLKGLQIQKEKEGKVQKLDTFSEEYYNKLMVHSIKHKRREDPHFFRKHFIDFGFVISYHNINRLRFDFLTCVLVLFDCFIVPFKNSFGLEFLSLENKSNLQIFEYSITAIFILDILICFRKSFIKEKTGVLIQDPKLIAKEYLKFYFWIDLLGCLPFDSFTDNTFLRMLPLLKTIRLLRFQRLIQFMNFSSENKSKIRIIQLLFTILILIHWATCLVYVVFKRTHDQFVYQWSQEADQSMFENEKPDFEFQFWIPQNHLNDGETDFYELHPTIQYAQLFYYVILLILGNDIVPQTAFQISLCIILLFAGELMVATIFGGISAEIQQTYDEEKLSQTNNDFIYFSLIFHEIDTRIQYQVLIYVSQVSGQVRLGHCMQQLIEVMNPGLKYLFIEQVFLEELRANQVFGSQQQSELMFMAMLLGFKMNISDEEIITQGDDANFIYIISQGSVAVLLNYSVAEANYDKMISVMNVRNKFLGQMMAKKSKKKINKFTGQLKNLKQKSSSIFKKFNLSKDKSQNPRKSQIIQQSLNMQPKNHEEHDHHHHGDHGHHHHGDHGHHHGEHGQHHGEHGHHHGEHDDHHEEHGHHSEHKHEQDHTPQKDQKNKPNRQGSFELSNRRKTTIVKPPIKVENVDKTKRPRLTISDKQVDRVKQLQGPSNEEIGYLIDQKMSQLQSENKMPSTCSHCHNDKYRVERKPIGYLQKGEIFGEIGLLTNSKRTCTIVTKKPCSFQTLSLQDMMKIQEKFPNLYDSIYENMRKYNDEDTVQKKQFVNNIPYLQGLDEQILLEIVHLMRVQVFEKGSYLLKRNMTNDQIMIIWEGTVQVRVEYISCNCKHHKSYWLGNLDKGSCISVYKSFSDQKSLVSYIASSKTCIVQFIDAKELEQLGSKIKNLDDRLNVIKLKIKNNMVSDIDFFTFPKRFLQDELEKRGKTHYKFSHKNIKEQKKQLIKKFQTFTFLFKLKMCKLPDAIVLLNEIRQDFERQRNEVQEMIENSFDQQSQMFNIRGIYEMQKIQRDKSQMDMLLEQVYNCFSDFDSQSNFSQTNHEDCQGSIKCQSFHTNDSSQVLNEKQITSGNQISDNNEESNDVKSESHNSHQKSLKSCSHHHTNKSREYMIKNQIHKLIRLWKDHKIELKNGRNMLATSVTNSSLILDLFLQLIEQQIFQFRNFELLKSVITNAKNDTQNYRNQVLIASRNLEVIFSNVEQQDIEGINNLIKKEDDLIIRLRLNEIKTGVEKQTDELGKKQQQVFDNMQESSGSMMGCSCDSSKSSLNNKIDCRSSSSDCFASQKIKKSKQDVQKQIAKETNDQEHQELDDEQYLITRQKELLNNLKINEQFMDNERCNMIYSEDFMDHFAKLNQQLHNSQQTQLKLQYLQHQIDLQKRLIRRIKNKVVKQMKE